ncbi:hypothetical protein ACHWQZ_G005594 [Mnemiopsis leidyi]
MTDLRVIGAGLGRTGTTSLKTALELLDLGPCHHMSVAMKQPRGVVRLWERVAAGEEDALKIIFRGYRSTLDYPGCTHFATLLDWNDTAKVILTVRDSPGEWARSARSTIFSTSPLRKVLLKLLFCLPLTKLYYLQFIQQTSFSAHNTNPLDPDCDLETLYTNWNAHVKDTVPEDKLLVYNVKEGWEPLCRFLEVPVPGVEFPRLNDRREYKKSSVFERTNRLACLAVVAIILATIALGLSFGLYRK